MRIAVITHDLEDVAESERDYLIGNLARIWRDAGHDVRFLPGGRERWPADVGIVHVDLSVVPARYAKAGRRYPIVLNDRVTDIRKSVISTQLVDGRSAGNGPVIVKSDLNSSGVPELKYHRRTRAYRLRRRLSFGRPEAPFVGKKDYTVHDSYGATPRDLLRRPGVVVERFIPEREGHWYIVRRLILFGGRSISVRVRDEQPIIGVPAGLSDVEWIADEPDVLEYASRWGLDFGKIDYVVHDGQVVVIDVNKTMGSRNPEPFAFHSRIAEAVSHGLEDLMAIVSPSAEPE